MIWDRFDDAHDAVLDEISEIESDIEELRRRLVEAGVAYPPFEAAPKADYGGGPHEWYMQTVDEQLALARYRDALRRLLEGDRSE